MAVITIHYSDGRRVRVPLAKDEVIVGRDASCDLALEDAITSRRHARFHRDESGCLWISDLKSKNGILVNDQRVDSTRIKHGDQIGIGTCRLLISDDTKAAEDANTPPSETVVGATSAWRPNQDFELSERRLKTLYNLNERLTGRLDRNDLLRELLAVCREQLRFERAGIAVCLGDSMNLEWVDVAGAAVTKDEELTISRSIVDRTLHQGERIVINDTEDGDFDPTHSIISNNIRSAMCVPMEYLQRVRGVIYGDRTSSTGGYGREDIDFFAALGRLGAMGLATVHLVNEVRQRERVELQLGLARQIQERLFPKEPLRHDHIRIDALNDPGQKISGDYYDFFVREDGKIVVVIADVAGKGVPASLLMANLQAAVRITLDEDSDLPDVVDRLNTLICSNAGDDRFVTAIFGLLDLEAREFRYINAGHHLPIVITDQREFIMHGTIDDSNLPIGVEPGCAFTEHVIKLTGQHTTLLFYTDGVPDAENDHGEQYTEERFLNAIKSNLAQTPADMVERLRRSIKQFTRNAPQTDDITLLAVEIA